MCLAMVGCLGMKMLARRIYGVVEGVVRGAVDCWLNMCVCGSVVDAGMREFGFACWDSRMGCCCCCRGESRGIVVRARRCRRESARRHLCSVS